MASTLLSEIGRNTGVRGAQPDLFAHSHEKACMTRGTRDISVRGRGFRGSESGTDSVKTSRQVWICLKKKKKKKKTLEKKPALVSGMSK